MVRPWRSVEAGDSEGLRHHLPAASPFVRVGVVSVVMSGAAAVIPKLPCADPDAAGISTGLRRYRRQKLPCYRYRISPVPRRVDAGEVGRVLTVVSVKLCCPIDPAMASTQIVIVTVP